MLHVDFDLFDDTLNCLDFPVPVVWHGGDYFSGLRSIRKISEMKQHEKLGM